MYGRVALGPLRPCGFASLRQPDACGAGESVATATNVQREGRAPARPLPLRRFRSSGSSTLPCNARRLGTTALPQMNQYLNAIVNRKFPSPRRRGRRRYGDKATNYQLPPTSSTLLHGHFPRRRGCTPFATACAAHFVRGICRYGDKATIYQLPSTNYQLTEAQYFCVAVKAKADSCGEQKRNGL